MMPPNVPTNGQAPDPMEQISWLKRNLDDAHLVIGQQQVTLLQLNQGMIQQQQQIAELETRLAELEPDEEKETAKT